MTLDGEYQYSQEVAKVYRTFSDEEMNELFQEKEQGSIAARDLLINSCLPLVKSIAEKFRKNNKHIDFLDMVQEGNLELIKAVNDWDYNIASKVTTVASYYITNRLIDLCKEGSYLMKNRLDITRYAWDDMKRIKEVKTEDVDTIEKETGLSHKRIVLLLSIMTAKRRSISSPNGSTRNFVDFIEDQESIPDTNIDGCLADLLAVVENTVEDEDVKGMFNIWLKNIKYNNRARRTAAETGVSVGEVSKTIRQTKKKLREAVQAQRESSNA